MTIQINLPPEIASRLREEAKRLGEADEVVALKVLDRNLPPALNPKARAAIEMLEKWEQECAAMSDEDLADNARVLKALDDDRPSHRKLFPDLHDEKHPQ